jgi:hypothetical protein
VANTVEPNEEVFVLVCRFPRCRYRPERDRSSCRGMEQAVICFPICDQVQLNACCTSGGSSDHDMRRVASILCDASLYPSKGFTLVSEPVVGCDMLAVREEAVWSNSEIEGDEDNSTTAGLEEPCSVQIRIRVPVEPSALYEDEDG